MLRLIRGFSPSTGFDCFRCHLKCCATEYGLPILEIENKVFRKEYNFAKIFIQPSLNRSLLLRGDSCPFLDSNGLCILHDTSNKPLICQTYPLIFWKVDPDLILVWLNPCRGNGFQWVAEKKDQITDIRINDLVFRTKDYFQNYWGESIDKENPFINISKDRIHQELMFFSSLIKSKSIDEITAQIMDKPDFKQFSKVFSPLINSLEDISPDKRLSETINSVLYWIRWSPVGLQFTKSNSNIIFTLASLWIDLKGREILSRESLPISYERYLQQVGSFLATAILPSFWKQLQKQSQFKGIKHFSECVINILEGTELQNAILGFID
jgi:Fe-S-cluster containining protein